MANTYERPSVRYAKELWRLAQLRADIRGMPGGSVHQSTRPGEPRLVVRPGDDTSLDMSNKEQPGVWPAIKRQTNIIAAFASIWYVGHQASEAPIPQAPLSGKARAQTIEITPGPDSDSAISVDVYTGGNVCTQENEVAIVFDGVNNQPASNDPQVHVYLTSDDGERRATLSRNLPQGRWQEVWCVKNGMSQPLNMWFAFAEEGRADIRETQGPISMEEAVVVAP